MAETVLYQPGMNLGRTFDLQKHQPGLDIFTDDALSKSKSIERHQTTIRYSVVNNSRDINNILDVGGEISLKVKAGILKVDGMGSYLKEDRSNENTLEILTRAHVETMTETMTDSNTKPGWNKNVVGSHYIRSITYGGDLIARIQIKGSDSKQMKDIKAKVGAGLDLKIGGVVNAGVRANFRKMEDDLKAGYQIEISYYSTSLHGTMPRDIEGMLKALDSFNDQVMEKNKGKGVPLICELVPLNVLDPNLPQVLKDKSLDVQLRKLEENYDDVVQAQTKLECFLEWAVFDLDDDDGDDKKKKVLEIEERLDDVISVMNRTISKLDLTSGGEGSSQIEEAMSIYKKNKKLGGYRREVVTLVQTLQPKPQEPASSASSARELPHGDPLDILIIGKTGHGKSATANSIFGEDRFVSERRATSVTSKCQREHGTVGGREICVVDSPGMMDTDHPEEICFEVGSAIAMRPDGYHAFLIVLSVDARMTQEEQRAITMLKTIFGKDILMKYAILVFTHGDSFYSQQRKSKVQRTFHEYIEYQDGALAELLDECHHRYVLMNNMEENPVTLRDNVIELISAIDSMVQCNDGEGGKKYTNDIFEEARKHLNKERESEDSDAKQERPEYSEFRAALAAAKRGVEIVAKAAALPYIDMWNKLTRKHSGRASSGKDKH